jgi:peptidoglycan hydrolase CwlO-like protein
MPRFPKPKILGDINPRRSPTRTAGAKVLADKPAARRDNFSFLPERLNLGYQKVIRLPLARTVKVFVCALAAVSMVFGSVYAPTIFTRASSSSTADTERQALEAQLQELENQINQYENQVVGYKQQGKTLAGEIKILDDNIARLNLQIQATNLILAGLNRNIGDTQSQISATESSIEDKKAVLSRLLQNLYESERAPLIEVFLKNPRLSDFFNDLNNITLLQNNLRAAIEQITDLRNELQDKQQQLLLAKADTESVKAYQASQKEEINNIKSQKNRLLAVTKGQESKYQALLKQTKETAAQIRSRIFQLLGGGELSFEEAYRYAKLAGDAVGVRPALILAVLDRESALGQNVGKCSYKTAMSPANQALFLQITSELNINPDVVTVSCPNKDGVYGGAMGPAQFLPSTWNLYKDAVSVVTGHKPASPWNNSDAFVATALYLKDAMTGCSAIYNSQASIERCTAAKYYAGSRWRNYLWTYGEAVVSRAKGFQDDIDTITG